MLPIRTPRGARRQVYAACASLAACFGDLKTPGRASIAPALRPAQSSELLAQGS